MSNKKFTEKLWNESRNSIYKHHPEITSFIFMSNRKFTKLHFTTLNYALYYVLHPKLSDYTLCTLNYHTYHALHLGVIFAIIFNRTLLRVSSTCFLLRWNKVKRLKHPSSNQLKQNLIFSAIYRTNKLKQKQLALSTFFKKYPLLLWSLKIVKTTTTPLQFSIST